MAFNKEKVMDAARKFVEKGQLDKAIKEYLRIVREDPQDVRVWLKIGDLYARKGQKPEATETYLKVARFYQDQGFFTKAVAVYKQILKLDARLVEVHLKLAELYRQLGLMSDAMQHFEQVAAHFHREGKTKEALATVRQLVDLDPQNVATRIKLAELYSKEGMNEDAIAEFTSVCEQLRRQGRQDDFIKVAERLLWHRPDLRELNRELAGLYLRKNDPRRALQKLQLCFKADPRDVETLALLAQAFQALDQKGKTVSVLKELARVLDDAKQRGKAEDVYRKILQFAPGDPDAVAYLNGQAVPAAAAAPAPAPVVAAPAPAPAPSPMARAKLNFTGDVAALRPNDPRMTGAMPLIDESQLSQDFELPDDDAPAAYSTDEVEDGDLVEVDDDGDGGLGRAGRAAADFAADFDLADQGARASSAAGEEHADEIAKILTETDVYVKYGLHQKAVDHLRRVFALDPDNVEARERLKDVLLAQGREREAIVELLRLAEISASYDAERAESYLREVLSLDGGNRTALDLVRRFGLDISVGAERASSDYAVDPRDLAAGGVAPVDDDYALEQIDYGPTSSHHRGAGAAGRADSFDGIDPSMFDRAPSSQPIGRAGSSSRRGGEVESFAPTAADNTRQVAASEVAALVARTRSEDVDRGRGAMGSPPPFRAPAVPAVPDTWQGGRAPSPQRSMRDAIDAELDDALSDDIDQQVAAELAARPAPAYEITTDADVEAYEAALVPSRPVAPAAAPDDDDEELPFDPAAARAFDLVMRRQSHAGLPTDDAATYDPGAVEPSYPAETPVSYIEGDGATRLGPPPEHVIAAYDDATYGDAPSDAPADYSYDTGSTIDEDSHLVDTARSLEDVLEDVDDYAAQGMYLEAAEVLRRLLVRHPGHPLVNMRLRDLEAQQAELDAQQAELEDQVAPQAVGGTETVDVDDLEEIPLDDVEPEDDDDDVDAAFDDAQRVIAARHDPDSSGKVRPSVVLERPVEDSDADTHFDLGLAYKEMGLFDEAIKAFDKVTSSPHREVQSRMMIGLCHREQHNLSEAVHQFKAGLHASSINERERQSLLYEIGTTYEALGDPREAIYYYEMVVKRDPTFLDAADRLDRMHGGRARVDDADGAIDSLLADD